MLPTRDSPQNKTPAQTEIEGLEINIQSKWERQKAQVAILISDKIDFKNRAMKRDPEGHFIIILKGRIHQEAIRIVNMYEPYIEAHKYIKNILEDFNKDIDSNTILVEDVNTPL